MRNIGSLPIALKITILIFWGYILWTLVNVALLFRGLEGNPFLGYALFAPDVAVEQAVVIGIALTYSLIILLFDIPIALGLMFRKKWARYLAYFVGSVGLLFGIRNAIEDFFFVELITSLIVLVGLSLKSTRQAFNPPKAEDTPSDELPDMEEAASPG